MYWRSPDEIVASINNHLNRMGQHRAPAFNFIFQQLIALKRPLLIVETGCARKPGNYEGDGLSTVFWDHLVSLMNGHFESVDISEEAVKIAREMCIRGAIHCKDSVEFLANYGLARRIDLLYLDSFDFNFGDPASAEHHLKEIECIYDRLPSGCLIAVDDCHSETEGKHTEVQKFMQKRGVEPIVSSYVTIWRKP